MITDLVSRKLQSLADILGSHQPPGYAKGRLMASVQPQLTGIWRDVADRYSSRVAADLFNIQGGRQFARMVGQSLPFVNDLDKLATEVTDIAEMIHWTLYSYRTYAAAGQTQLVHFQQSVSGATNGYGDTNLTGPGGRLSGGEAFLVTAVRVNGQPALVDYDTAAAGTPVAFGQWNEVYQRNCWLELKVGQKFYIQCGPLALFPAGFGPGTTVFGQATVVRNQGWPNNGHPSNMALWKQSPPTLILPNRDFQVNLNWTAVLAVTTAGKIGVHLDGYIMRVAQ